MSLNVDHRDRYEPTPQTDSGGASGLAWATLALGVASWFVLPLAGAVAALICGLLERRKIAEGTSRPEGQKLVLVGLVAATAQLIVVAVAAVAAVLFAILTGLGLAVG